MKKLLLIAATIVTLAPVSAWATVFELETFDDGWTMGSSWTVDRRLPDTVESALFDGDYRLHFGIAGEDKANDWRDYEGIKHEVTMPEWGFQSFSVDLYIGSDWDTTDRNAGLWAQGMDSDGNISAWPILVYRNSAEVDAGFYSFDYINGGWDLFSAIDSGDVGAWHTLQFDLTVGTGVEYFVDGTSLGVFADADTVDLSHVILNAYNTGVDADIYFDNFTASATPEPASLAIWGLLAVIGMAATGRRR